MKFLEVLYSDPNLFTKVLLFMYAVNCLWYVSKGLYGNAWYWFAAMNITLAATWGMK